jgi:nicotinamidase-related amidase
MHPIALERTVHLCLDVQRLFGLDGPWPTPWLDRVLPVIVRLAERTGARTVFTRFIPPAHAEEMPGRWQTFYRFWNDVTRERLDLTLLELVPALQRFVPPATIFDKMQYSAFADGRLAPLLRARNVDTLVVSGAETDVCVLATVMAAVDLGFRVVLVTDAICSSSDEGHDALMRMYEQRLSIQLELAAADDLIAALHPG